MPLPVPGTSNTFLATLRTRALGTSSTVSVTTAAPVTLNVAAGGPTYPVYMTSTGEITAWTVTGAVDGQTIEIMLLKTLAASPVVWPTNFRFAGGVAPAPAQNSSWHYLEMRYVQATGLWIELARSLDIPSA